MDDELEITRLVTESGVKSLQNLIEYTSTYPVPDYSQCAKWMACNELRTLLLRISQHISYLSYFFNIVGTWSAFCRHVIGAQSAFDRHMSALSVQSAQSAPRVYKRDVQFSSRGFRRKTQGTVAEERDSSCWGIQRTLRLGSRTKQRTSQTELTV